MGKSTGRWASLSLGVIGCGDIAQYIAWFIRLTPGMRLVACCDKNPERAERFAHRFHIPHIYTDPAELLDHPEVEAVYVAVPHYLHPDILSAGISRNIPTLLEKPVAHSLQQGLALASQSRTAQVKVGVNYQYRYDPAAFALCRAAQTGELGSLHYARCHIPWHRGPSYFESGPWRGIRAQAGGGTLLTQGSHAIDLALWALNSPPVAAVGMVANRKFHDVEVEDLAQGILELENGAMIEICSSMVSTPEQPLSVEIYGERGTIVYRAGFRPRLKVTGVKVHRQRPPVVGLHALHSSLLGFRDWLTEGKPYLTPIESALPALAAVEAIYQSASQGKKCQIESTMIDGGEG